MFIVLITLYEKMVVVKSTIQWKKCFGAVSKFKDYLSVTMEVVYNNQALMQRIK